MASSSLKQARPPIERSGSITGSRFAMGDRFGTPNTAPAVGEVVIDQRVTADFGGVHLLCRL